MTHDRDTQEIVALYAVGRLDLDEVERFERHLAAGCDTCQAALLAAHGIAGDLALLLPLQAPRAQAREAMFARVRADARARAGTPAAASARPTASVTPSRPVTAPRSARTWRSGATAAGCAAAAAVLIVLGWRVTDLERKLDTRSAERTAAIAELDRTRAQIESEVDGARAELDRTRAQLEGEAAGVRTELERTRAQLETELAQAEAALGAITAPGTKPVALAGQGERKQASATAYLNPAAGRLMLFVRDLPPPAPGKTYQVWVIVEGKPVSLGVFDVGAEGRARLGAQKLPELRGPITIAVTEEPAGGVPQPTGPMVLAGS